MSSDSEGSGAFDKPAVLRKKRGYIKSRLTRIETFAEKFDPNTQSRSELTARLSKLIECWKEYDIIQTEVELYDKDEDATERELFENKYFKTQSKLEDLIAACPQSSQSIVTSDHNTTVPRNNNESLKLPKITLPKFSGKFEEWLDFHHAYLDMIHNAKDLSATQKFYYLRSCLVGDALQAIQEIKITPENYESAWSLVKRRYHNKRLITKTHVQAILDMKPIDKRSASGLRHIYDMLNNRITALKNIGEPTEHWGTLLENIMLNKLDSQTKNEWEIYCVKRDKSLNSDESNQDIFSSEQTSSLDTFLNFLNRQCLINEALEKNSSQGRTVSSSAAKGESLVKGAKYQKKSSVYVTTKEDCLFCKEAHSLSVCNKFSALSESERYNKAREFKLCMNCLRANHRTINCKSPYTCKFCHRRHHSLVHLTQSNQAPSEPDTQNITTNVVSGHSTTNQETILATAIVNIEDVSGRPFECRALLDSGSQSNFIKQSLAFALGLKRSKTSMSIQCINGNESHVKFIVRTFIKSKRNNYRENLEFLVLKKITSNLPSCNLKVNLNVPPTIHLADEEFFKSRGVDILLGADVFYQLLLDGQIKLGQDLPILQNTELGWIVGGKIPIESGQAISQRRSFLSTISHNESLDNLLTSFWKVEEITDKKPISKEEEECEGNYITNVKRQEDGRFIVSLPFSQDPRQSLGESRPQALKRFYSLERRLKQDTKLKESYTEFLNEYSNNDEMELVSNACEHKNVYYLPHHPVVKESSSTTKVRVVFDASSKTSTNKSLNDILMIGSTLQKDIFSILLSFRLHKYVFTADIKQMYRRILIDESQRDYQRILWREDSTKPIQTFRLKTVTYGTASAPYLAIRTLFKLADDEEHNFPLAAPVLRNDFYVDDVLTGDDDLNKLIEVQKQLIELLASGKFELRKWCANHHSLVDHLPPEHLEANFSLKEVDKDIKALGVIWQPNQDSFKFTILNNEPPSVVTKRTILSDISRLYDPIGFVTPVIITAKLIMQELWSLKNLKWDDPVPEYIVNKWILYRNNLNELSKILIPRNVIAVNERISIQIHGFCDASTKAYGAVLYIRTSLKYGKNVVHLLCSKSRIAPLKTLSLPRLELCGALLLSQLIHKCKSIFNNFNIQTFTLWTDSTIVLHWINAPPNTWQTFVANRTAEIQTLTSNCTWRHVKGTQNPADLITRSVSPEAIGKCVRWWRGPEWLALNEEDWPESICTTTFDPALEERRKNVSVNVNVKTDDLDIETRYSDWEKLLRVTAFCKRFIHNCTHPQERMIGPLEGKDYVQAEYTLIKIIQAKAFESDIKNLRKNRVVSNQLKPLNPFLDDNGIIRVGGRLRHANVEPNHKNQILLPKNHHITQLICKYAHHKTCHGGPQLLLSTVRTKYWPLNGRIVARSTVHKCIQCSKTKPVAFKHLLGDLPPYRVQPAQPFNHCGIDYCGPIYYRRVLQRRSAPVKAYVALFICMVTKAVHLELVPDLTTKKFLNALQRVIARRGKIQFIYTDNATNFIGANNEIQELKQLFMNDKDNIDRFCASEGIKWSFIPPRSPHFGGLWESGIKIVKGHLKRVLGKQILTYDELETLLVLVEGCVNSRPITPLSEDPNDLNPLTPAHLLVGQPLTSLQIPNLTDINTSRLNRWQLIQQIHQSFWKRWSQEYLSTLQRRSKWADDHPCPEIGTLVVLKEGHKPPLHWEMGRIIQLHPGPDGVARVATVKTSKGIFKRCIAKLCPLLVD